MKIPATARSVFSSPRIAVSSYVRVGDGAVVAGWFRTVLDSGSGPESRCVVTANTEPGPGEPVVHLAVSLGDTEHVSVPVVAGSPREWMSHVREPGEVPDTGLDAVAWLLGVVGEPRTLADGSCAVDLERGIAAEAAAGLDSALLSLTGQPDHARARVWPSVEGSLRFLIHLPKQRRPRYAETRRLVTVKTGLPPFDPSPAGDGSRAAEDLATRLLARWPTGESLTDTTPPDPALFVLDG